MNGLSLFANVGIAETYLKKENINIVIANELLPERAKFYKHLYPECEMIQGDITDKTIFEKIIASSREKNVEFVLATPPCQGMSIAGEMNPYDERNSLVKYAIDAVVELMPKYVLLENVPQQLTTPIEYEGIEITIPQYIEKRLGEFYVFNNEKILNAMDYEIPQMRRRAIILMARKDLNFTWEFPRKSTKIVTLQELFDGVPDLWPIIKDEEYKDFFPKNTEEALNFHKWHRPPEHIWRNVLCMLYTPTGNTAFDNKVYYPKKANGDRIKGYDTTYHRLFWSKPCATITRYNGIIGSQNNVHPGREWKKDENGDMMYTNPRVLTIYELMLVSTLPTDWDIPSWASNGLIRHVIGEGIPPKLIEKIVHELPKEQ